MLVIKDSDAYVESVEKNTVIFTTKLKYAMVFDNETEAWRFVDKYENEFDRPAVMPKSIALMQEMDKEEIA